MITRACRPARRRTHNPETPGSIPGPATQCDQWNSTHQVGATVRYHHIIGEPAFTVHKTRTAAEVLSGHTAVVWLEGVSGCVCLEALSDAG